MANMEVVASQLNTLLSNYGETRDQMADLLGGPADGGPNGDGRYPVTLADGETQTLVPSPLKTDAKRDDVLKAARTTTRATGFNSAGGTTGQRGYYAATLADGSTLYLPSNDLLRPDTSLLIPAGFPGNGGQLAMFGDIRTAFTGQGNVGNIWASEVLHSSHAPTGVNNYTVARFTLLNLLAGSGDGFGHNVAIYANAGLSGSTNVIGHETDVNNNTGFHWGDNPLMFTGADGWFEMVAYKGVLAGPQRGTGVFLALSLNGNANRGYMAYGNFPVAGWQIKGTTPTLLMAQGAISNGIDLTRATGMDRALAHPLGSKIVTYRSDGSPISQYATADHTYHVGAGALVVDVHSSFRHSADNAYSFGTEGRRASAIWCATPTITTSDRDAKTDFAPLPDDILERVIAPVDFCSYRYIVGGQDPYDGFELQTVQDEEEVDTLEETSEIVDGKLMVTKVPSKTIKKKTTSHPKFDAVTGDPIMIQTRQGREEVRHPVTGDVLQEAVEEKWEQDVEYRPVMIEKMMPVTKYREKAGNRQHVGIALDPETKKALMDGLGIDFGGIIIGEDGKFGARYEEFVGVLWKGLQVLHARGQAQLSVISALADRLDALEANRGLPPPDDMLALPSS